MALNRIKVLSLAGNAKLLGQGLGGGGHHRVAIRPRGKGCLVIGFGGTAICEHTRAKRATGIAFHPARDDNVMQSRADHRISQQKRIEPACALSVDA